MGKLTEKFIKGIEPPLSGRKTYTDGTGLELRVTTNGVRSWGLQYSFRGKKKRVTLGTFPSVSLKEARNLAAELRLGIAKGIDPNAAKAEAKAKAALANSFDSVFELYVNLHLRNLRETTRKEYLRAYKHDILPALGHIPIGELSKFDVIKLVDKISLRAPVLANRVLTYVRTFCNWCIGRGYMEHNPTTAIPKPFKERARSRVLSLEEVQALYHAAGEVLTDTHRDAFQLVILSGMRRSEVCKMRWSEILPGRIRILAERSKNHRSFDTPITNDISEIFERQKRGDGEYVFSFDGGATHIDFNDRMTKRLLKVSGVQDAHIHDFRRAATIFMEDNGTPRFTIERVLNHADNSVTEIYARSDHFEAKKKALEFWADALFKRYESERVIPFAIGTH